MGRLSFMVMLPFSAALLGGGIYRSSMLCEDDTQPAYQNPARFATIPWASMKRSFLLASLPHAWLSYADIRNLSLNIEIQ
jgi:hypothetical protein